MKINYYLLHGFLGDKNYFAELSKKLKSLKNTHNIHTFSLFSQTENKQLSPEHSIKDWCDNFNSLVKAQMRESATDEKNILIGYSMGGRLGVHAYFQNPDLWHKCFFISSNPGIIKSSQKMVRMAWEDGWCYQIDNKPWSEFLALWNKQDIFKHCKQISQAKEAEINKSYLKRALKNWSLTKHQINRELLKDEKLHWVVGEMDSKYMLIHSQLKQTYDVKNITVLPGLGHRISNLPDDILKGP